MCCEIVILGRIRCKEALQVVPAWPLQPKQHLDWIYQDYKLIEERLCRKVVQWIEDLFGGRQNRWGRVWANRKMRARFVNSSCLFCNFFFFGVMGYSVSKQKDESQACKPFFLQKYDSHDMYQVFSLNLTQTNLLCETKEHTKSVLQFLLSY